MPRWGGGQRLAFCTQHWSPSTINGLPTGHRTGSVSHTAGEAHISEPRRPQNDKSINRIYRLNATLSINRVAPTKAATATSDPSFAIEIGSSVSGFTISM